MGFEPWTNRWWWVRRRGWALLAVYRWGKSCCCTWTERTRWTAWETFCHSSSVQRWTSEGSNLVPFWDVYGCDGVAKNCCCLTLTFTKLTSDCKILSASVTRFGAILPFRWNFKPLWQKKLTVYLVFGKRSNILWRQTYLILLCNFSLLRMAKYCKFI